MSWNYRLFAEKCPNDEWFFSMKEAYYNKEGVVDSWTEAEVSPHGDTLNDFWETVTMYQAGMDKDVVIIEGDKVIGEESQANMFANRKGVPTLLAPVPPVIEK